MFIVVGFSSVDFLSQVKITETTSNLSGLSCVWAAQRKKYVHSDARNAGSVNWSTTSQKDEPVRVKVSHS